MTEWVELPRGWRGLVLRSAEVEVVLLPDKGCDIYSWTDRESGVDVLFKTPWGLPPRSPGAAADSQTAWLERYPGGWQVLCPNGGAESTAPGGVRWGFHGEACLVPWEIADAGPDFAELTVRLHRAPLRLRRRLTLRGRVLTIDESVGNTSPDEVELMWSHHPAFGAPFLGPDCVLATGASTVLADDEAPGTLLAPDSLHPWPSASTRDGAALDLSRVPHAPAAQLAYLTDFDDAGWFAITNPRLGLGVGMRWPTDVFGHAWLWQELNASPGYPWWREAYVCAVEPATTIPGQGVDAARRKGSDLLRLAGGETRDVVLEAVLFRTTGRVRGIGPGGVVETDPPEGV
ncbi:MAG TPA: aldose 1-epimerase [Actinophytocola sp.]|nr:aldose 1-epimerase [Actinophytocola sp.]